MDDLENTGRFYTNEMLDNRTWLHCRCSEKLKCPGSVACGRKCCRIWIFRYPGGSGNFLEGNDYPALDLLAHHQDDPKVPH